MQPRRPTVNLAIASEAATREVDVLPSVVVGIVRIIRAVPRQPQREPALAAGEIVAALFPACHQDFFAVGRHRGHARLPSGLEERIEHDAAFRLVDSLDRGRAHGSVAEIDIEKVVAIHSDRVIGAMHLLIGHDDYAPGDSRRTPGIATGA